MMHDAKAMDSLQHWVSILRNISFTHCYDMSLIIRAMKEFEAQQADVGE